MKQERKIICFHNPDEENGYLSNWYLSDFETDGKIFSSMEQYMMFQKAILFDDQEIASKIMETKDPAVIRELGRKVADYNEEIWNGFRQILVYKGLVAKFSCDELLRKELDGTGDAILAESAYSDRIWGIGRRMDDPKRLDISCWRGENLLGFSLMAARDEIRQKFGMSEEIRSCL